MIFVSLLCFTCGDLPYIYINGSNIYRYWEMFVERIKFKFTKKINWSQFKTYMTTCGKKVSASNFLLWNNKQNTTQLHYSSKSMVWKPEDFFCGGGGVDIVIISYNVVRSPLKWSKRSTSLIKVKVPLSVKKIIFLLPNRK